MNSTAFRFSTGVFLLWQTAFTTFGQGAFQNLDFESATVPPLPAGQYGGSVPISDGLPHWSGFLGADEVTEVLHNNFTLGTPSLSILGPDCTFSSIPEGSYAALLQPGPGPGGVAVDASLSQIGTIPTSAESLRFTTGLGTHFMSVSFGSQTLPVTLLSTSPLVVYGVDISSFAGSTDQLKITALYNVLDNHYVVLDSITFSDQPIPEPSAFGLLALGGLLLGWRFRHKRQ